MKLIKQILHTKVPNYWVLIMVTISWTMFVGYHTWFLTNYQCDVLGAYYPVQDKIVIYPDKVEQSNRYTLNETISHEYCHYHIDKNREHFCDSVASPIGTVKLKW